DRCELRAHLLLGGCWLIQEKRRVWSHRIAHPFKRKLKALSKNNSRGLSVCSVLARACAPSQLLTSNAATSSALKPLGSSCFSIASRIVFAIASCHASKAFAKSLRISSFCPAI